MMSHWAIFKISDNEILPISRNIVSSNLQSTHIRPDSIVKCARKEQMFNDFNVSIAYRAIWITVQTSDDSLLTTKDFPMEDSLQKNQSVFGVF